MPATQLGLYGGALRLLKHSRLATTLDTTPARYNLDDVYTGAKAFCLEQGQWSFASVSTSIAGSASSNRGFSYRFAKPTDFVRLIAISASSSYYPPHEAYAEDATYWYSNEVTIYVTYVSSYSASATVTMTIAAPGVVTWTNHELVPNDPIQFSTTGALPTGVTAGTTYYVLSTSLTANTFRFAATPAGSAITTTGSQSGVHTGVCISGGDLSKWPESYGKVVEAYLAMEVAPHLSKDDTTIGRANAAFEAALQLSLAKDAINRTVRVLSSSTESIYKGALRLLGARLLNNFDDRMVGRRIYDANGEAGSKQSPGAAPSLPAYDAEMEATLRRLIDEVYDDGVEYMLGQGMWNFGSRTVAIEAETDVEPDFGYNYTFEKPSDYIRLIKIADNGTMWPTLMDDAGEAYLEEGDYFHANVTPLYIQYVSDGVTYGRDTSLWPMNFRKAVEAYLALEIAPHAPRMSARGLEGLRSHYALMLKDARNKDAVNQASVRPPPGRLVRSRAGFGSNRTQRREN